MKSQLLPKPLRAPSTARMKPPLTHTEQRLLLNQVSWDQYQQMIDLFAEQRLYMTFSSGQLELRMPLNEHESASEFISGIINFLTFFLGINIYPLGSTTFRSSLLEKGLEPDKCFYLNHIEKVRSKKRLDLSIDPPPDLAIEIEITSSLIPRVPIYAQLGIPELWRFNGKKLTIDVLHNGEYLSVQNSQAFPQLSSKLLLKWIKIGKSQGYTTMLHTIEAWCKEQL